MTFLKMAIVRSLLCLSALGLGGIAGWFGGVQLWKPGYSPSYVQLLLDSGYAVESASILKEHLSDNPKDEAARLLLARAFALMDDVRSVVSTLQEVSGDSIHKPEALLREGQGLTKLFDAMGAEEAWKKCTEIAEPGSPMFLQAWRELADLYASEDRQFELKQALAVIREFAPKSEQPKILDQMTTRIILRIDPNVRAKQLLPFVEGNPKDFRALSALGFAYVEAGYPEKGMPLLKSAVEIGGDDPMVWRNWLQGLYHQGDFAKLVTELNRAPLKLKDESGYWKLKSNAAQEMQDWIVAEESLKNAIEIDPYSPDLLAQIATVSARLGKQKAAEEFANKAKEVREDQAQMQKAYEDWRMIDPVFTSEDEILSIVSRLAQASRKLGQLAQAEGWDLIAEEIKRERRERQ